MMKRGTQREGLVVRARLGVVTLLMIAGICLMISPVLADDYTRWFDPILLTTPGSGEHMEVALQVSPGVSPGPYEYVYWVTNLSSSPLSDFYFTCVGVPDPSSFDPTYFTVWNGTRDPGTGDIWWGTQNSDWGNLFTGSLPPLTTAQMVYDQTTGMMVPSTKFRWSSLTGDGLMPGDTLGFSFTSIYAPALVARDLAAGLAVKAYNGTQYANGPGTQPDVPEWPAVAMALSGLGSLGVLRRRFQR
jgi:hypothetical protein